MLTRFAQVLAVVLCVASVAFLGVSAAVLTGSYPWSRHTEPLQERYVITATDTETGTEYKAAKRVIASTDTNDVPGASGKNYPQVITAAYKDMLQELTAKEQALQLELPALQAERQRLLAATTADEAALKAYEQALLAQQTRINADVTDLKQQTLKLSQDITNARNEQISRRRDVERLKAQYEQIRADYARATEQQAELTELLHRLKGALTLVERRTAFLQTQVDEGLDAATAPEALGTEPGTQDYDADPMPE